MTSLRLPNHQFAEVVHLPQISGMILGKAISAVLFLGLIVGLIKGSWRTFTWSDFLLWSGLLIGLPIAFWLLLERLQSWDLSVRNWPYWIEFGEVLTYRDKSGVHSLQWTEVRDIEFVHIGVYNPDEVEDYYSTDLIVTLIPEGRRLSIRIGAFEVAAEYSEKIVRTLCNGLQSPQRTSRRSSANALGRLGPNGLLHLRETANDPSAGRDAKDAARAILNIEAAVPYLKEATTDNDEGVREASINALQRIQYRDA